MDIEYRVAQARPSHRTGTYCTCGSSHLWASARQITFVNIDVFALKEVVESACNRLGSLAILVMGPEADFQPPAGVVERVLGIGSEAKQTCASSTMPVNASLGSGSRIRPNSRAEFALINDVRGVFVRSSRSHLLRRNSAPTNLGLVMAAIFTTVEEQGLDCESDNNFAECAQPIAVRRAAGSRELGPVIGHGFTGFTFKTSTARAGAAEREAVGAS